MTKQVLSETEHRILMAQLKEEEEFRKQRLKQQQEEEAERLAHKIENTTLPKWVVNFIMSHAYQKGHSASVHEAFSVHEINMIANGMLCDAERHQEAKKFEENA